MAAMDAKRWVLGSPHFSCIRRARDLRDDILRFSFAWRPRLRFLNPPPPWPRQACFLGSGIADRVAEGSGPYLCEKSKCLICLFCLAQLYFWLTTLFLNSYIQYITQARGSFSSPVPFNP